MKIHFSKYQGTGNDFVMIDNRNGLYDHRDISIVKKLSDRRYGIGADGVIYIIDHSEYDFEMIYYNSDGSQSFCGNGARCSLAFAKTLNLFENESTFMAIDGVHKGVFISSDEIQLKMNDVNHFEKGEDYYFIDTGSPHYITYEKEIFNLDILEKAHLIRYNERFNEEGTNVNFLEDIGTRLKIRTYERGVENETLSCGTGVTAAAISFVDKKSMIIPEVEVETLGGVLKVKLKKEAEGFKNIWLIGPAKEVFNGSIEI